MSQAGKFIPGGTGRKTSPVKAPIRGPERPGEEPPKKGKLLNKAKGLNRPVQKKQRLPILVMSSVVCCLLVSIAWYEFGVKPVRMALELERAKEAQQRQQLAALGAKPDSGKPEKNTATLATVTVNSNPAGSVTIGEVTKPTPATFDKVPAGKVIVTVRAEGFNDYTQEITATAGKPTDLGTLQLSHAMGTLELSSPDKDVTYKLTGPDGYLHEGQTPDKLLDLPAGTYQLAASMHDWQLPVTSVVLRGNDVLKQEIKVPYASLSLTSNPSGATVRKAKAVLGQTPLTLSRLSPGEMNLSLDLPPYTTQRITVKIAGSGSQTRDVTLAQGKDFIAGCGMPMVWIPDGFWAGKYEVTQRIYENIVGNNPSAFHRPNRPVEMISWEDAIAFCQKLNEAEQKAGKLPKGYHYTLPTEAQWDEFSADASLDDAAMSRTNTLSSTVDVGASEPNKFGLYDTLGNVWEWTLNTMGDSGAHSMRGGSWLSSAENFANAGARTAGAPKYADRFTGFRVVLVPQ